MTLKKLLTTAITTVVSSIVGVGVAIIKDAIAKEQASKEVVNTSPGGYDFTHRLEPASAGIDAYLTGVHVKNYLEPSPKLVSYWHAWFYNDDKSSMTGTNYIPVWYKASKDPFSFDNFVYYSAYSNTGYTAVIEVRTTNYFYYLAINPANYTIALTYSKIQENPNFYSPRWTEGITVDWARFDYDVFNIMANDDKTTLTLEWIAPNPNYPMQTWYLPY